MSIRAGTDSTAAVHFLRSSGGWCWGKGLHGHCLGQHFLKTCEAGVGPTAPGRKFLRIREAQGQGGLGGRWQAGPQHCSPTARTPPAGPRQGAECCHQQDQQAWPHSPPGLICLTPQGQGHWGVVEERPRSLERDGSEVFGPLGPGQSGPVLLVSLCEPPSFLGSPLSTYPWITILSSTLFHTGTCELVTVAFRPSPLGGSKSTKMAANNCSQPCNSAMRPTLSSSLEFGWPVYH